MYKYFDKYGEYKIIQIIPMSREIYAVYDDEGKDLKLPVICMALIEEYDGRRVVFMSADCNGSIDIVDDCFNFKEINYEHSGFKLEERND